MRIHLLAILTLGIATNLDNVCLGMAYGIGGRRVLPGHNLLISLVSGMFAMASCALARWISAKYAGVAMTLGALLLIALGAYTVAQAIRTGGDCPGDKAPRTASLGQVLALGVALALNCLAASFGVGLSGASAHWLGLSVTACSFAAIGCGNALGLRIQRSFSARRLNAASGALLALMGIWELFI